MDKEVRATEVKAKEVLCNKEVRATEDKAKKVLCSKEVVKIRAVDVKNIKITNRAKYGLIFKIQ